MSEDITKGLPRNPSFEDQVLARLDALDGRLQALEVESQRRAVDTKPIWERALAEILELKQGQAELKQGQAKLKQGLAELKQGLAELQQGQAELQQGQAELQQGLAEVKEGLSSVERQIGVLSGDVIHVRADQRHLERRLDKLEPKPVQ